MMKLSLSEISHVSGGEEQRCVFSICPIGDCICEEEKVNTVDKIAGAVMMTIGALGVIASFISGCRKRIAFTAKNTT